MLQQEGWVGQRIAFKLRAITGVLVEPARVPEKGVEMTVESAREIELRVRKPAHARHALRDGQELEVTEGFARTQAPRGVSRIRIEWSAGT